MYIPTKEALDQIPDLQAEAARLQEILAEAKTAKKKLKAVEQQVRELLKGPIKRRGPRKKKAATAQDTATATEQPTAEPDDQANE